MPDKAYGPRHLGYTVLPSGLIDLRVEKQSILHREMQRWIDHFLQKGVAKGSWEEIQLGAQQLSNYTAEPEARKALVFSLRSDYVGGEDYYPTHAVYRAICPWRGIVPRINQALQEANPQGMTLQIYQSTPLYGTIKVADIRTFYGSSPDDQKRFLQDRKADIRHTSVHSSALAEDYNSQAIRGLLWIAFSPESKRRLDETVSMEARLDFRDHVVSSRNDQLFTVRVIRALEAICATEPLVMSDEFMVSLLGSGTPPNYPATPTLIEARIALP